MTYYKSKEGGTDPEVVVSPGSSRTKYLPRIYVNEDLKTLAGSSHSINKNILKTNQGKKNNEQTSPSRRELSERYLCLSMLRAFLIPQPPGLYNPTAFMIRGHEDFLPAVW